MERAEESFRSARRVAPEGVGSRSAEFVGSCPVGAEPVGEFVGVLLFPQETAEKHNNAARQVQSSFLYFMITHFLSCFIFQVNPKMLLYKMLRS